MTDLPNNGGPPIVDPDVPDLNYVKFYFGDFLNGTAHMSLELRGAYITTLCVMYDRMGGFPYDEEKGAILLRVDRRVYRRVRDQLLAEGKFFLDGDMIRNARVEREITDYVREYRRRREAALEREAKRRAQTSGELRPNLSGTSAELPGQVPDKSAELEAKNQAKTTDGGPQPDHILEARSYKLEARKKEKIDMSTPGLGLGDVPLAGEAVDRKAINRKAAREAFELWQGLAKQTGLPVPRETSFEVYGQKIASRMYEHAEPPKGVEQMLAVWKTALAQVERSSFLRGMTKHGFRADLKFLCQRESFDKLITGGFGNGAHAGGPSGGPSGGSASLDAELRKIAAIVGEPIGGDV